MTQILAHMIFKEFTYSSMFQEGVNLRTGVSNRSADHIVHERKAWIEHKFSLIHVAVNIINIPLLVRWQQFPFPIHFLPKNVSIKIESRQLDASQYYKLYFNWLKVENKWDFSFRLSVCDVTVNAPPPHQTPPPKITHFSACCALHHSNPSLFSLSPVSLSIFPSQSLWALAL